jgi:hypothetical protein
MAQLSNSEFSGVYTNALRAFGAASLREVMMDIYKVRVINPIRSAISDYWMYVYALNTWDNTDVDNNYMTEAQMLAIVHKVQTTKF